MKNYIVLANWKMELTHHQSLAWLNKHYTALVTVLRQNTPVTLVLCPSFTCLEQFNKITHKTVIKIGAQDCSYALSGAYTADTSPQTLQELGCTYCIVGHSERRRYYHETDAHIAQKVKLLIEHSITPVVCIGETEQERSHNTVYTRLTEQLEPVFNIIHEHKAPFCIAYEPVWAIGTGVTPTSQQLSSVLAWIQNYITSWGLEQHVTLLYGGSVTSANLESLAQQDLVDGYLVGKASLDFQELKKIVLLVIRGLES